MALGSRDVDEITDIIIDITRAAADIDTDRLSGQLETWLSRYLGGSVADLDFVGMGEFGHADHAQQPPHLPIRPRASVTRIRTASRPGQLGGRQGLPHRTAPALLGRDGA
jgi:hypothetical protein